MSHSDTLSGYCSLNLSEITSGISLLLSPVSGKFQVIGIAHAPWEVVSYHEWAISDSQLISHLQQWIETVHINPQKISYFLKHPYFHLVPEPYYIADKIKNIFAHVSTDSAMPLISSSFLQEHHLHVIYRDNSLLTSIQGQRIHHHHFSEVITRYLYLHSLPTLLAMYSENNIMFIGCKKKQQLIYVGAESVKSIEDILYFLVNAIHDLSLDPKDTPLLLSSDTPLADALYTEIKKYFPLVEWATPVFPVRIPKKFPVPWQKISIAITGLLCA